MEIILAVLSFLVAILAVMQGWQMVNAKRNRHNPNSLEKLDTIIGILGKMQQRLNDIWDKVKD